MKKFVAIILVIVMALSLCACGKHYVDENGKNVEMKNGDVILDVVDNFMLIDKDYSTRYSSMGTQTDYIAVLHSSEYAVIVDVGPREYALWTNQESMTCNLHVIYITGHNDDLAKLKVNESEYTVLWYGQIDK